MKIFYLLLVNGQKIRLAYYPGISVEFKKINGVDLSFYIDGLLKGKPMIKEGISLAWLMAIEGEKLDGRHLSLNEKEFGRLFEISTLTNFMKLIPLMTFQEN